MQNPFNKLTPQQAAFLSGLAGAVLAALLHVASTGQPLTWNSVVYALASALGAYLAKLADPNKPIQPQEPTEVKGESK